MQQVNAPGRPSSPSGRNAGSEDSGGKRDNPTDGRRILIVEDEVFVALHARDLLQGAGHEVVGSVIKADEAIAKAEELSPDLILMDIRLLGKRDGIDAAVEIFDRFGIRCLFTSGHADDETRARASKANPAGFVSKPYTKRSLLEAVESANPGL